MDEKTPNISEVDIRRIIERDFSQMKFVDIEALLKMYKSDSDTDRGRNRVYAAILKLSDNNIQSIEKYLNKANNDYRDVIGMAEYPNYSEHAFEDDLSMEMESELINKDWVQYELWLNKV